MKVASGHVSDRPFARTVFSLASKRFSGDLVMLDKRRETKVVWSEGQIVAAHSASPADTPGRQALTHGLVNSSTLGIFVQEMGREPEQEPVALLTRLGNLTPQQSLTLKHHVLVRSAARIFALPEATFTVDNEPSMVADPELPALDVRWLIYFGLRTHYSVERLASELSVLGQRTISLGPEAEPVLPAFGFGDYEQHVLARLQAHPMTLADLLASGLDANIASCVVYALVACGYVQYGAQASGQPTQGAAAPPAVAVPAPAKPPKDARPPAPKARTKNRTSGIHETVKGVGFVEPVSDTKKAAAQSKARSNAADAETTIALVEEKLRILEAGANHYNMLGLEEGVADSAVRQSYFQLARRLHPDRLQALGVTGMTGSIQSVFAAINEAFKVLSNPKELAHYKKVLAAGGEKAFAADQAKAEKLAAQIFQAEEHFNLGEMALRRDQFGTAEGEFAKACALRPEESEYQALHSWAMYCNSKDRAAIEGEALGKMSSALLKSPKSVTTRLYHAKLLKLLGRTEEAIASFKKLLQMSPGHREAELELRVLADQPKAPAASKKGFFGR